MRFIPFERRIGEITEYLKRRENFVPGELNIAVSPYRICPLGAQIDHQGGPVLGMTINAGTVIAFVPNLEKRVRLYSANYAGVAEFSIESIKVPGRDDWGKYAMGAAKVLGESGNIKHGFISAVSGSLPESGLSSSASVGLAYLTALAHVNGIGLHKEDYVELDRRIENDYLRLKNGLLDQSSIVYGRKDCIIHIDTRTGKSEVHTRPEQADPFKLLIIDSGIKRELTSSGFNTRVEECGKAAGILGIMGGVRSAKKLSDVPDDVFWKNFKRLPEELRRRAAHYYGEVQRVKTGLEAWDQGDMMKFGRLMNESCQSSFSNYECGNQEMKTLQEIISKTGGVYGSRMNGGGYGGSVTAFVTNSFSEDDAQAILEQYKTRHPEAAETAGVYFAESDDGLRLL